MKRTPAEDLAKFNESVGILVKAYLNDTLQHGFCSACAVGNMIAAANGYQVQKDSHRWLYGEDCVWTQWDNVFCSNGGDGKDFQSIEPRSYYGEAKRQIESTGYHWGSLAKIEKAFESVFYDSKMNRIEKDEYQGDYMFDGLMRVVDALASIHSIDLETTESARKLFVKV